MRAITTMLCLFLLSSPYNAASAEEAPFAFKHLASDPEMMAIWRNSATSVDTPQMADAVIRSLFALSYHVAGCSGPGAVSVPIQTTVTTTTRSGTGIELGQSSENYNHVLKVRPEFATLARQTASYFSDNVLNPRFIGVRDLISQDGCDGPRLARLEDGLAKLAGVRITRGSVSETSLGSDWRGFVMSCLNRSHPKIFKQKFAAARNCNYAEAALAEMGNPEWYAAFRKGGLRAEPDWTENDRQNYYEIFEKYRRDRSGEVWSRGERLLNEANLW